MRPHQATCVAIGGRGLLIEGAPGSGKSGLALALALIDRGARLVGDDSLLLEAASGRLLARPHPVTRGLLEVRNLGLIPLEPLDGAAIALVLTLDALAPRFIEAADTTVRLGVPLPLIRLTPHGAVLPIVAELALERHGLPGRI